MDDLIAAYKIKSRCDNIKIMLEHLNSICSALKQLNSIMSLNISQIDELKDKLNIERCKVIDNITLENRFTIMDIPVYVIKFTNEYPQTINNLKIKIKEIEDKPYNTIDDYKEIGKYEYQIIECNNTIKNIAKIINEVTTELDNISASINSNELLM